MTFFTPTPHQSSIIRQPQGAFFPLGLLPRASAEKAAAARQRAIARAAVREVLG